MRRNDGDKSPNHFYNRVSYHINELNTVVDDEIMKMICSFDDVFLQDDGEEAAVTALVLILQRQKSPFSSFDLVGLVALHHLHSMSSKYVHVC